MKLAALVLALGAIAGTAAVAHAQTAPAAPDPLADLQGDFGTIVGNAFHAPDPVVAAASTPGSPVSSAGVAFRTSLEVPGALFADFMAPFADPPAPAAAPAPPPKRHARMRVHHHRMAAQG